MAQWYRYQKGVGLIPLNKEAYDKNKSAYVINDEIAPLRSHANGKIYTSRSKYIAEHEAAGFVVGDKSSKRREPEIEPTKDSEIIEGFKYALEIAQNPDTLNHWRGEMAEKGEYFEQLT